MEELFNVNLDNPAGAVGLYLYHLGDITHYPRIINDQNLLTGSFATDVLQATKGYKLNTVPDSIRYQETSNIDVQGDTYQPLLTCKVEGDSHIIRNQLAILRIQRCVLQWEERHMPQHPDIGAMYKMVGTPSQGMELTYRYLNEGVAGQTHIYELTFKAVTNQAAVYTKPLAEIV